MEFTKINILSQCSSIPLWKHVIGCNGLNISAKLKQNSYMLKEELFPLSYFPI